jgi:hypothetical protein
MRKTRKATAKLRQQLRKLADALPAAAKTKPDAGHVPMEMVDLLERHRMFAEGIELAVEGAGRSHSFDSSPLVELLDQHINALRAFSESLHKLVREGKS